MNDLEKKLNKFTTDYHFTTKGPLCVALVVTRHAMKSNLPIEAESLLTDRGGQVLGLGRSAVQAILADHEITRVLASEGGRTSRGSIDNMREYVSFLNELARQGKPDLGEIENFWIGRVNQFFQSKPFKLSVDHTNSIGNMVEALLDQASARQRESNGTQYVGALIQHLVGAKLDSLYGPGSVEHHAMSTSDAQTSRHGDFFIGDTAIHVTTAPSEGLMLRCKSNLQAALKPLVVTLRSKQGVAEGLADNIAIKERVDIFSIEQFLSSNIYELGSFNAEGRAEAIGKIIERYNEIIDENETDASLKIDFSA